jgi:hypothetical protein
MIFGDLARLSWIARGTRSVQTLSYSTNGTSSSVNASEIAHFSRLSSLWWDEQGEFGFLHKMNPVRMQFVREKVLEIVREENGEDANMGSNTLRGLDILDVGCGGGLLSEVRGRYLFFIVCLVSSVEFGTIRGAYCRHRCLRIEYCYRLTTCLGRPSSISFRGMV